MLPESERQTERQSEQIEVIVGGIDRDHANGHGLRVSLRLAAIIQLIVISTGIGGTYVAVRASIDVDHQRIEEAAITVKSLQTSLVANQALVAQLSGRIDNLSTTITYLAENVRILQDRIWTLQEKH
jgi:hypothetical protein